MFDENKEKQFILQLFNLECSDVQDVSCIRAGNTVIIDITLASDPVPCPVCGCDQPHIKNYVVERHIKYTKKIKLNARRHNVKFRSIQII